MNNNNKKETQRIFFSGPNLDEEIDTGVTRIDAKEDLTMRKGDEKMMSVRCPKCEYNLQRLIIVYVLCSDGGIVAIDTSSLQYCPPVLARFLGITGGFKPPRVNKVGHLVFAADFQIPRINFLECITYLRSGYVRDVMELMETFNILGGCDVLDEFYQKQVVDDDERVEEAKKIRKENPLTPEENTLGLFQFEAHPTTWVHGSEWQVTAPLTDDTRVLWWRKRVVI